MLPGQMSDKQEDTTELDAESLFQNARYYFRAWQRNQLTRMEMVALMMAKLEEVNGFHRSTFAETWPGSNAHLPNSVVLSRRYYMDFEYTEHWFLFNEYGRIFHTQKTSDPEWDNYAFSYDQGLPPELTQLDLKRAAWKIFDFVAPTPPSQQEQ